jgi:hypothetical protein
MRELKGPLNSQEFKKSVYEYGHALFQHAILNTFHPDLRGFRALRLGQEERQDFLDHHGIFAQKQQGIFMASFIMSEVVRSLKQDDYHIADALLQTGSELVRLSLDSMINEPDWDFKVPHPEILNKIISKIEKSSGPHSFHQFYPDPFNTKVEYGFETEILPTTTAGLNRIEFTIGTRENHGLDQKNAKSSWIGKDYSASITLDVTDENQIDIRGKDGISTDGIRAKHIWDEKFEISPATLPRLNSTGNFIIDFPEGDILQRKDIYSELVARAMMQSAWFGFEVNIPKDKPLVTDSDLSSIFSVEPHGPLRRNIIIGKMVDAFMMDPKKTFHLMRELGVIPMSKILSTIYPENLDEIEMGLPSGEEHRLRVLTEKEYCVFDIFSALINKQFHDVPLTHPGLNYLYFYTDLFPDYRESNPLINIPLFTFTEPLKDLLAMPSRLLAGQLKKI